MQGNLTSRKRGNTTEDVSPSVADDDDDDDEDNPDFDVESNIDDFVEEGVDGSFHVAGNSVVDAFPGSIDDGINLLRARCDPPFVFLRRPCPCPF